MIASDGHVALVELSFQHVQRFRQQRPQPIFLRAKEITAAGVQRRQKERVAAPAADRLAATSDLLADLLIGQAGEHQIKRGVLFGRQLLSRFVRFCRHHSLSPLLRSVRIVRILDKEHVCEEGQRSERPC